MKVSIENLVKVTAMAAVGTALLRVAADRLNIPGIRALLG